MKVMANPNCPKLQTTLFDEPTTKKGEDNFDLYKQVCRPESFLKQNNIVNGINTSTVLCYLQTYFMLLIAVHKSVNDKLMEVIKCSQFQPPLVKSISLPTPTNSPPTQSTTCSATST